MEASGQAEQEEEATALCVALYPQVFSALAYYLGDRLLAEDLAQETMLRVWRERSRVSDLGRPDRWALRVAFNLARSRWRRFRIERREQSRRRAGDDPGGELADAIAVRSAVAALPPRQRAAVVLRYFNDLSVADAALVLGCAEGTVKALTSQAIDQLRVALAVELDVPEEEGP